MKRLKKHRIQQQIKIANNLNEHWERFIKSKIFKSPLNSCILSFVYFFLFVRLFLNCEPKHIMWRINVQFPLPLFYFIRGEWIHWLIGGRIKAKKAINTKNQLKVVLFGFWIIKENKNNCCCFLIPRMLEGLVIMITSKQLYIWKKERRRELNKKGEILLFLRRKDYFKKNDQWLSEFYGLV